MSQWNHVQQRTLEMDDAGFKAYLDSVGVALSSFVKLLPDLPVGHKAPGGSAEPKTENLPTKGIDFAQLLAGLIEDISRDGYHFHSPGYQCYIPTGGLLESSIAELIVSTLNRWVGYQEWAPALNQIEKTAVKWLCRMIGLPDHFSGILTSGGSLANFTAVYTARFNRLPSDTIPQGVMYLSSQAHHSLARAGVMTGIQHIRKIAVDHTYRVDLTVLDQTIANDIAAGLTPFLLVGLAGSTATGSIDDLSGLAAIADRNKMWFHVDAAWAGGFSLIERCKKHFVGIERADSVTIDPHKALFLPMGCGALLVKEWGSLHRAHAIDVAYLPNAQEEEEYNPAKTSLELLRPSRGLQLWLPLKMHGIEPFVHYHEEKMDLTDFALATLRSIKGIEILHEPQVAIVVFRLAKPGATASERDAANRELIKMVNDDETKISGADLENGFWPRLIPFGLRTHREHVERTLQRIGDAVAHLS